MPGRAGAVTGRVLLAVAVAFAAVAAVIAFGGMAWLLAVQVLP